MRTGILARSIRKCMALAGVVSSFYLGSSALGQDLYKPFKLLKQPFEAAHRKKPVTGRDDSIETLAKEIDWLEHFTDKYGTIVTKHPDIWGQSRLMRHRYEYESMMASQINNFEVRMNGALSRSDQSFLGMALALQAATSGSAVPGIPTTSGTNKTDPGTVSVVNSLISDPTIPVSAGVATQQAVINRSTPFAGSSTVAGFSFQGTPGLSLEPATQLDQMSRYLNHLHELRRVNEGDDIADSPGYSLNLVRIPVSILPGKQTQKGYGAEVTITAEPYLSEELLPMTMRNMIINDVADMLSPVITYLVNDPESRKWLKKVAELKVDFAKNANSQDPTKRSQDQATLTQSLTNLSNNAANNLKRVGLNNPSSIPVSKNRRARLPLPLSQVGEIIGSEQICRIAVDVYECFYSLPTSQPTIAYVDVQSYLSEELQAAYDFLGGASNGDYWQLASPELTNGIRERRVHSVAQLRHQFFCQVGVDDGPESTNAGVACLAECSTPGTTKFPICKSTTANLAWAVLVEAALLNERLTEDMREAVVSKGCHCVSDQCGPFIGANPSPEARHAFVEYVRCRWPVRVFALDPVSQDQNIADAYARRRELQVAVALAFASGQMTAQSMMRFTRRLEWDMATIDINQTAVAFSHGNDTFGWRFHPRYQTPPIKGNLATLGENLFGGPTTAADMRSRQIEPGMRECTAIVVMPSFVPYMTFDVRTNWFKLTNPKCSEISMEETMKLSRSIQAMRHSAAACSQCAHLYRDGEVHRLFKRVEQLDRELPLQTMQAQIPYENTSGGFELFNTGITDLAPELAGWYGAPGIHPNGPTRLYVVGNGLSVHSTQLIAGGKNIPFKLISRQVMEVDIPAGVQTLQRRQEDVGRLDEVVAIYLATPYGVSNHLLIDVAKDGAALQTAGGQFAWRSNTSATLNVTLSNAKPKVATVQNYYTTTPDLLMIHVPSSSLLPAQPITIRYAVYDTTNGKIIGTFTNTTSVVDGANSAIVLTPGEANTLLVTSVGSAAKAYLDWLSANNDVKSSLKLQVKAAIEPGNNRPIIPIEGGIDVEVEIRALPN